MLKADGKMTDTQGVVAVCGNRISMKWTSERRDKIVKSLMGNQLSRKINIWPHKDGYKCKCRECRDKKNERTRISVAKNKGLCL